MGWLDEERGKEGAKGKWRQDMFDNVVSYFSEKYPGLKRTLLFTKWLWFILEISPYLSRFRFTLAWLHDI